MPTAKRATRKTVQVRTKRLPDGTLLRIHLYRKSKPRGGTAKGKASNG